MLVLTEFQNGCHKVVIELRVVQFWSEIILVISSRTRAARSSDFQNHAFDFRPNCTTRSSITIINPNALNGNVTKEDKSERADHTNVTMKGKSERPDY